jgi:hypothetical protein
MGQIEKSSSAEPDFRTASLSMLKLVTFTGRTWAFRTGTMVRSNALILPHGPGPARFKQTRMAFVPKMNVYMHMLAQINPTVLPALRIAATFFFIVNLVGGAYIFRNRHRFFDRDPNVDNDIPAMRKLRVEVVMVPWFVLTTLILILLIGFWLA